MIHHNLTTGGHWAVGWTGESLAGQPSSVLVQVQEGAEQSRIALTPDEALRMADLLQRHAARARGANARAVLPRFVSAGE